MAVTSLALVLAACAPEGELAERADPLRSSSCATRVNNTTDRLLECVTLAGVRGHQAALQAIADANGDMRVAGSPGYDASVDYADEVLRAAGYLVSRQEIEFQTFYSSTPPILRQVAPTTASIANNILAYSGSGDVTAEVSSPTGALGCNAADWAGFPAGNIALVLRGTCEFSVKATHAYNAGASGVVIYNNVDGVLNGTLGTDFTLNIPVTSVTQQIGLQFAATVGLQLRLTTDTFRGLAKASNVLAESRAGDAKNVVMVGAHLDSVNVGPGINDNGSGAAALLETAVQMAKVKPRNKVRFALWTATESGRLGSTHYVEQLTQTQKDRIALYLDFDTIGSPNYGFFVYDGDDSDGVGAGPGPGGSAPIEEVFEAYYAQRGLPFKGTDLDGLADYAPFMSAGIPVGGVHTGGPGIKTPEEQQLWGGTAGVAYDPCYHAACDTYANRSDFALEVNADAVAWATLQFAMSTSAVNGLRGKGNFTAPNPTQQPTAAVQ